MLTPEVQDAEQSNRGDTRSPFTDVELVEEHSRPINKPSGPDRAEYELCCRQEQESFCNERISNSTDHYQLSL